MKKRIWIIIGIVVILACAAIGSAVSSRSRASAQSAAVTSSIGQVARTTLSLVVEPSGSIAASDDAALSFGMNGTVAEVNVDVGSQVKQGDVLAKLDTAQLEVQVAQAEQAYLLQQATYSKTVEADPEVVVAAQAALNNANNAYQIALHKSGLSGDQITISTQIEDLHRHTQQGGVINTAYIERLNATCWARLTSLERRGRALAR